MNTVKHTLIVVATLAGLAFAYWLVNMPSREAEMERVRDLRYSIGRD